MHYCNIQADTWYQIEKRKKYGTEMKSKTTHRGHPSTTVIKGLINQTTIPCFLLGESIYMHHFSIILIFNDICYNFYYSTKLEVLS